jgi:hypothetical protein
MRSVVELSKFDNSSRTYRPEANVLVCHYVVGYQLYCAKLRYDVE